MNLKQYIKKSSRTANVKLSKKDKILNWTLGLGGEASELWSILNTFVDDGDNFFDENELIAEAGDVLWYVVQLAKEYDIELSINCQLKRSGSFDMVAMKDYMNGFIMSVGNILDIVKKNTFHGHEGSIESNLKIILMLLTNIVNNLLISMEEVMKFNIKKLEARYQGEFSEEKSINRG